MPDCSCPGWKESWGLWLAEGRGGQAAQSPWRTRPRTLCGWQCYAGSVLPPGPPVALSHLCSSCPSPFCLSALALLHNVVQIMISYAGQGHLFSPKEKAWAPRTGTPPDSTLAFSKLTLAGGLKCVYFLDLFFNKKEKEDKVLRGDSVGSTGAGSSQEPDGWDVQRSWQIPLHPEPREAQPRNTGQCAGPAGCWGVERNLAPAIYV